MTSYQRFLRERKETKELDEINQLTKAAMKSPDAAFDAVDFNRLKAKRKNIDDMSDAEIKRYAELAKKAGETAPRKVLDRLSGSTATKPAAPSPLKDKIFGGRRAPVGTPSVKKTDSEEPMSDVRKSIDTEKEPQGETLSQMLQSLGVTNTTAAVQKIKAAVETALANSDVQIKIDPSFMV